MIQTNRKKKCCQENKREYKIKQKEVKGKYEREQMDK